MAAARRAAQRDDLGQLGDQRTPACPRCRSAGSGDSGFGRIHGADGLREFARAKAITRQRIRPAVNLTTFRRTDEDMRRILRLVTLLHGRRYKLAQPLPRRARSRGAPTLPAAPLGTGRLRAVSGCAARLGGSSSVLGVDRGQRGAADDQVGGPLGDGDHRRVRVAPRHGGHHRGVHHAQPLHPADPQLGVHHAGQAAGSQAARRRPSRRCRPGGTACRVPGGCTRAAQPR